LTGAEKETVSETRVEIANSRKKSSLDWDSDSDFDADSDSDSDSDSDHLCETLLITTQHGSTIHLLSGAVSEWDVRILVWVYSRLPEMSLRNRSR